MDLQIAKDAGYSTDLWNLKIRDCFRRLERIGDGYVLLPAGVIWLAEDEFFNYVSEKWCRTAIRGTPIDPLSEFARRKHSCPGARVCPLCPKSS